jgi:quercetin dioxygenase-like cupin family protein
MNRERQNENNMSQDSESKPKGLPGAQAAKATELVSYQAGAIVSRELVKRPTCTVTVFAFDAGQSLSEHTSSFNALVQVLEGEVVITISGKLYHLGRGGLILVPAHEPHALKAIKRFKMILTMIRS